MSQTAVQGVEITGPTSPAVEEVLTADALAFLADLQRRFNPRRQELFAAPRRAPGAPQRRAKSPASCPKPPPSAKASGRLRPRPPTSTTAASRSPAPPSAR